MKKVLVDKNGKFLTIENEEKTTNILRDGETSFWNDEIKNFDYNLIEPAIVEIDKNGRTDINQHTANKFIELVKSSRNPYKKYDRIFTNKIFENPRDFKIIKELKCKNCMVMDNDIYKYKIKPQKTQLVISYELSGPCNKKCWYCPQASRDFTNFNFDEILKNLEEGLDLSIDIAKKENRVISGQFLGGEITSWNIDIQEKIADIINSRKCENFNDIMIMTNGYNLNSPVIKKTGAHCLIHETDWINKKFEDTGNPKDIRMIIVTRDTSMEDIKKCIELNPGVKFSWSLDFLSTVRYKEDEQKLWYELKAKFFNKYTGYDLWNDFNSLGECVEWCEFMTEHEDWQFYVYDKTVKPCYGALEEYRINWNELKTYDMNFRCRKNCMPMLWGAWKELWKKD